MTVTDVVDGFHTLQYGQSDRFDEMKQTVMRFQRERNPVVAAYGGSEYLPVDAFRHVPVCTFDPDDAEAVFISSGTSAASGVTSAPDAGGAAEVAHGSGSRSRSRHYVRDVSLYYRSIDAGFRAVFGSGPFTFLAHLPAYASMDERSSLVVMARRIVSAFGNSASGLFLEDDKILLRGIDHARTSGERMILLGAAFGLLDLIETGRALPLPEGSIVVETGGMKTYRRSIHRSELHERLSKGFGVSSGHIRSEYGMCELLSQCWTREDGLFRAPPWMSVRIVRPEDPATECADGEVGVIAVVDLANVYSASSLVTQDTGVRRGDGFEVLGRLSNAELRGCNFLFEETP